MPRIFDNIDERLLPALEQTLRVSSRADFCVGYFNLRGWQSLAASAERFAGGEGAQARVLIGMHRSASDELRQVVRAQRDGGRMDTGEAARLKRAVAVEFRDQLLIGAPTNAD